MIRPGPKTAADPSRLPWRPKGSGAEWLGQFCRRFVVVPKGTGARSPMILRPWQLDLAGTLLNEPKPKIALWALPRGAGKSSLTAALALHHVFGDLEGARAVVVAQDERASLRLLAVAVRMVELNDDLGARCRVYKDRIVVARTGSELLALPGEAHRVEGEDASLGIVDEIGFTRRDAFESLLHSTGKRPESQLLAIGTPSPPSWREISPMLDLILEGRANRGATDFRTVEYLGDITHPADCFHCWQTANPGLGDLVPVEQMRASLPPRSRESEFRRARLGEWVEQDDSAFLPAGLWPALATGLPVPDGADVVLALDGSFNGDATALLVATVATAPHVDVVGLWEPPAHDTNYRVPILEVEQTIREAARRWRVVEIIADPYRWSRTLQLLESEGLPVVEFPQSPARLTPATTDCYQAAVNRELTHSGDRDLARHVANAVVTEDARGVRLAKERSDSHRRIDLAACLIMAHSRATWRATRRPVRRRTRSFAT